MSASVLGVLSGVVGAATIGDWIRRARALRIPSGLPPHVFGMAAALGLGVAAFLAGSPGPVGGVAAGFGIAIGAIFLLLRLQSRQETGTIRVRVGDPILDFSAVDDRGQVFRLSSLSGKALVLKFFRGHW